MTPRPLALLVPALCASLSSAACSSTKSSELETGDIRAMLNVNAYDNDVPPNGGVVDTTPDPTHGSFLAADLYKGDSMIDMVDLVDGDIIYADTNLNPKIPMSRGSLPGFYSSEHMDLSGLTSANFVLTRSSKTPAPSSKVAVPATIQLTAPKQDETLSLASGKVTFTWSNPVPNARIFIMVHACGTAQGKASTSDITTADTGSYDVMVADLGGAPSGSTCYLARIVRSLKGTIDPAWHSGSSVTAERNYWLTFTGTP